MDLSNVAVQKGDPTNPNLLFGAVRYKCSGNTMSHEHENINTGDEGGSNRYQPLPKWVGDWVNEAPAPLGSITRMIHEKKIANKRIPSKEDIAKFDRHLFMAGVKHLQNNGKKGPLTQKKAYSLIRIFHEALGEKAEGLDAERCFITLGGEPERSVVTADPEDVERVSEKLGVPTVTLSESPDKADIISYRKGGDQYDIGVAIFDSDEYDIDGRAEMLHEAIEEEMASDGAFSEMLTDGGTENNREEKERIAKEVAGYDPQDAPSRNQDPFQPEIDPAKADPENVSVADMMGGDSAFASDDDPNSDVSASREAREVNLEKEVSGIPFGQLDALSHEERRRYARKNGLEIPSTDDVRDRLRDTIFTVMRNEDDRVIPGPTGSGKSYTISSTRWGARDELTGGKMVVHLLPTRDARDEAAEVAEEHGGSYAKLRSRDEVCPLCAGDFDPEEDDEDEGEVITIDGEPASEWFERICNDHGIAVSDAHTWLEEHNDQNVELPCQRDGECEAIDQWRRIREQEPALVIGTHNFAHVPNLRLANNVVIDEEPGFSLDLSTDRLKRAIESYLQEANAMVDTWEDFWSVVTANDSERRLAEVVSDSGDVIWDARKKGLILGEYKESLMEEFQDQLDHHPEREWFYEDPNAHSAAPALASAILNSEERTGGRRVAKTYYEPLRPDGRMRDDEGYNREWLTVVFNSENELSKAWSVPDFSQSRSVVGLDAHPVMEIWRQQTKPSIQKKPFLDRTERTLWRRFERGLRVIQVGEATRPLASEEYFDWNQSMAMMESMRDEYGRDFRTAITAMSVEDQIEGVMKEVGVTDPETMHYGEEKSRNDFANENIGCVYGSIDPGDGYVLDLLAARDLDARPERADVCCKECGDREEHKHEPGAGCHECNHTGWAREKGREFVGEDADEAARILASVRENHVAQSAGRYARNADDPSDHATVFVATDAMPDGFVDAKTADTIKTWTKKQRDIIEAIRSANEPVTAHMISTEADVSKRYAREYMNDLAEYDYLEKNPRRGPHGRTVYADTGLTQYGTVDVSVSETRSDDVQGVYDTWSLRVCSPSEALYPSTPDDDASEEKDEVGDAGSGGKSTPMGG